MRMVSEMIKLVIYVVLLILGFCLLTDSTILYIYNVYVQKQNFQMKIDVVLNYVFIFCISEEQIYSIHTC